MDALSGTDALSVMNAARNTGYDGMDGYGAWFWIIIILFAFWGNGFGNRNNGFETDIDTRFLERDIFNTNQNVSNTACQTQRDVLDSKYGLNTAVLENRFNCSQNACATQKEILQNRYDNAIQTQALSAQASQCCCDLKTAIHAEGEATRAMIQEDKIQKLRDQVYATNLALNNANLANSIVNQIIPRPAPAYPSCSPFVPSYYGFGNNGCCNC